MASPLSSGNQPEDSADSTSKRSSHTPSPRKLKRLQSAHTDEQQSESKCKRCGWRYPIQNPDSRQRRHHKKICPKHFSFDTEKDIQRSPEYRGPDQSDSGGSSVLTDDHGHKDTAKSRKRFHFGEMDQGTAREREVTQQEAERAGDEILKQGSTDSGHHHGSGRGEAIMETSKEVEPDSELVPKEEPEEAQSLRTESDLELGSDSGMSCTSEVHETDSSVVMAIKSSDEVAKREDNRPADYDKLEGEKKNRALQYQPSHARLKGATESSHAGDNRTESEAEGKPVNVAALITKYEKGKTLPSDFDYMTLEGDKRSMPSAKTAERGPLVGGKQEHKDVADIAPAEEILAEGQLSTGEEGEHNLEIILKKQKTHELICPVCGSQITDRIIVRKKRTSVNKNGPNSKEITAGASDQEKTVKAITDDVGSHETWVERCFSYLGLFRRDRSAYMN